MTSTLPTYSVSDVAAKAAQTFASAKIFGGAYVVRRAMLRALATGSDADFAAIPHAKKIALLSILIRESRRYRGTHKLQDGTVVRLEFGATAKHTGAQRAVWYLNDLKAAHDRVRAVVPPKAAPAHVDEQLELERLADEAATGV